MALGRQRCERLNRWGGRIKAGGINTFYLAVEKHFETWNDYFTFFYK
jgi:hypothetical protein